jgi:hypothetical protein
MPSILRPLLIWFAALCLAGASMLPLSALASAATTVGAMTICSTHGDSGSSPLPIDHLHCHYCSGDPGFHSRLPASAIGSFRPTLSYRMAATPASLPAHCLSRAHQWPRAPPV